MTAAISERRIVFLVGAVQFINILDFMMVMPLGPDFASSLGFPASRIGLVGGAYTAAACVAGLLGAFFLDRFDRRSALAVAMTGLIAGTAAGGFATGLPTLMAARVLAGAFGGPATSISLAIIADSIPAERRGKALGAVMGAFAVASVLGVPAGLEIATLGGWRAPFFAVAALGVVIVAAAVTLLPPLRDHLTHPAGEAGHPDRTRFVDLLGRPVVLLSWAMTASLNVATFTIAPNLAAYFLLNLQYPRDALGKLYLVGGIVSFFATRLVGGLVDRYGSFRVGAAGTLWFVGVLYTGFVAPVAGLPVIVIFLGFMLSNSLRNVPHSALTSRVPSPLERARFMSIQSAVQHLAASAGAFFSAYLLHERPGPEGASGALEGMSAVAGLAAGLGLLYPVLAWAVEGLVKARSLVPMVGAQGPPQTPLMGPRTL
jgi:predicted MFS family arabinose efflux permease